MNHTDRIVELRKISVKAGKRFLLHELDFDVVRGEFVGVLGPNGSGKTTLLHVLNGSIKIREGSGIVLGKNLVDLSRFASTSLRKKVAMVYQHTDTFLSLPFCTKDVVLMGRTGIRGIGRRLEEEDFIKVDEIIAEFELGDLADRPYKMLSGGEKQKVQLARAIAQEPEILLLDEPVQGLDLDWQKKLIHMVEKIHMNKKVTIVMVTHVVEQLPKSCSRLLLLKKGKTLLFEKMRDALTAEKLSALYDCEIEVFEKDGSYFASALKSTRNV